MSIRDKTALIALALVTILVAVFGGGQLADRLQNGSDNQPSQVSIDTSRTINSNAKISGSGDPLPSNAPEDVVIELSYIDAAELTDDIFFELDYPDNWQATIRDIEGDLLVRKIDNSYYGQDTLEGFWVEITEEQASNVFAVDGFLLTDELINEFNRVAVLQADETCGSELCAVWEAENLSIGELLSIRVSKSSRKIRSVSGINDVGFFNMAYSYQDVELRAPELAN